MQQESTRFQSRFQSSGQATVKPLPEASSTQPVPEREKCQILAKRGFLIARNTTSGLVLLVYSREFQLGVLLHLPSSGYGDSPDSDNQGRAFAKSAIAMILAEFETLGVARDNLLTYVIGGSATDHLPEVSKHTVQRALWGYGLPLSACDLGGNQVRSIWMDVENGRTIVRSEAMLKSSVPLQSPLPVAS